MPNSKIFFPLDDEEAVFINNISKVKTWVPLETRENSKEMALPKKRRDSNPQKEIISLDHPRRSFSNINEVLRIDSPLIDGERKPQPASQSPSQILPYVQSPSLIDTHAPSAGICLKKSWNKIPSEVLTENPRKKQAELDALDDKFYIYDKNGCLYAIPASYKKKKRSTKQSSLKTISPTISPKNSFAKPKNVKCKKLSDIKLELGFPVGIEVGSLGIMDEQFPEKHRGKQGFACCVIAFGHTYFEPEKSWKTPLMDNIVIDGHELYEKSLDKKEKSDESRMKKFEIKNARVELEFGQTFSGKLRSIDGTDIYCGLKKCTRKGQKCIFRCRDVNLLIWKKNFGYFVYDPLGRNPTTCDVGLHSALITLKALENVAHLIINLSNLGNFSYILVPLKITSLGSRRIRMKKDKNVCDAVYRTINPYLAILRCDEKNVQSLPSSITSLIYTKIVPSNAWTVSHLRKIVRIGDDLRRKWAHNENIDLKHLPQNLSIEKYFVSLNVRPFISHFRTDGNPENLKEILAVDNRKILLQTSHMFFAAWNKNHFFYLFDPYPRNDEGEICLNESGQCCVMIFSRIEELCEHFQRNMRQIRPHENIYVHLVKIENVRQMKKNENFTTTPIVELPSKESLQEATSLNASSKLEIKRSEPQVSSYTDLVFDSPFTSFTAINGMQDKIYKNNSVSPSVDYLVATETHKLIREIGIVESANEIKGDNSTDDEIPSFAQLFEETPDENSQILARKILLKSDIKNLKHQKERIKHANIPPPHDNCGCNGKAKISLSQELLIVSNFKPMPDGSGIIFGTKNIFSIIKEKSEKNKMSSMVALATIICSYKYSIATWDSTIVDFVLDIAQKMSEQNLASDLPLMEIGNKKYDIQTEMIGKTPFRHLQNTLDAIFQNIKKIVLQSPFLNVAIIYRHNFYYLYEGFPCNKVGLRNISKGDACFMRFKTLLSLIRRIEANWKKEIEPHLEIILTKIILIEDFSYPHPTKTQKEELVQSGIMEKAYQNLRKNQQLYEIKQEIEMERSRIKQFKQRKGVTVEDDESLQSEEKSEVKEIKPVEDETKEITEEQPKKENSAKSSKKSIENVAEKSTISSKAEQSQKSHENSVKRSSLSDEEKNRSISEEKTSKEIPLFEFPTFGYQKCDNLLQIRGSTALRKRCSTASNRVRKCHFASIYALMFVMHHSLDQWTHHDVDSCLKNGKKIFKNIENAKICPKREITEISVENVLYDIIVKKCNSKQNSLKKLMEFSNFRYVVLQFKNCSFGLYHKDEAYHIFDAYGSRECCDATSELQLTKNQASWIFCGDFDEVLNYCSKRIKGQFSDCILYGIHILSHKKIRKNTELCLLREELNLPGDKKFLDKIGVDVPQWSRLHGHLRKKWKEFDIETFDLYSLWGDISPNSPFFNHSGKQFVAVNAIAIAMCLLYPLDEWNSEILNSIVIHGDRYFDESTENLSLGCDFEFSHLNREYELNEISLKFTYNAILYGTIYDCDAHNFDLSRALTYFFRDNKSGILMLSGRAVAFGREKMYYMFDCQSMGNPVFMENQGTAYVLRCCSMKQLLECLLVTLNVRKYSVKFVMYAVNVDIIEENLEILDDETEDSSDDYDDIEENDEKDEEQAGESNKNPEVVEENDENDEKEEEQSNEAPTTPDIVEKNDQKNEFSEENIEENISPQVESEKIVTPDPISEIQSKASSISVVQPETENDQDPLETTQELQQSLQENSNPEIENSPSIEPEIQTNLQENIPSTEKPYVPPLDPRV